MTEPGTSSYIDEDYGSEFDYDAAEVGEKRKSRHDLADKPTPPKIAKPNKQIYYDMCSYEQGRIQQKAYLSLDAYTRHKKLINDYVLCYQGSTDKLRRNTANYKTDHDIIKENHKFLWEEEDDAVTWGQRLAKKYYDRLFKEYCLCDLTRYKDKKVGMRWRTEKEVVLGEGQFFCGNIHCNEKDDLNSWEVLFGYREHGDKRSALVKLRLCERCSYKLNYGYKGKAVLKKQKKHKSKTESEPVNDQEMKTVTETSVAEEDNVWKQPVKEDTVPSKEDTFEEFLEDLFL